MVKLCPCQLITHFQYLAACSFIMYVSPNSSKLSKIAINFQIPKSKIQIPKSKKNLPTSKKYFFRCMYPTINLYATLSSSGRDRICLLSGRKKLAKRIEVSFVILFCKYCIQCDPHFATKWMHKTIKHHIKKGIRHHKFHMIYKR